jgi:hypothetical protein
MDTPHFAKPPRICQYWIIAVYAKIVAKMHLRKNIKIEDIPIVWTTNLSDEEIRELYAILVCDSDLWESGVTGDESRAMITLRLHKKAVEFKEGYCLCCGMNNFLAVIYRSDKDWELWHARQAEINELKDEQESEKAAEAILFKVQDDDLRQNIAGCLNDSKYWQACEILKQRYALRNDIKDERQQVGSLWQLRTEAIEMFSKFPSTDDGIAFLEQHGKISYDYMVLADRYYARRQESGEPMRVEVEKVFRTAITKFSDDGPLLKHICLFWERQGQLARAVEFCQFAIDRNLRDDTVTGFLGRMKRLRKRLASQAL